MSSVLLVGYGYVGSYLVRALRRQGHLITLLDMAEYPETDGPYRKQTYQALTHRELEAFDAILWFAGHSSVPQSTLEPEGAIRNNTTDLFELMMKKPDRTKLIYASSASVYSGSMQGLRSAEDQPIANSVNVYDASKIAFDAIAAHLGKNVTGLRMGTVSGWSPRIREELIFNAMNISALRAGKVKIANPQASRSILFLNDLSHFIGEVIGRPALPRIVNCGSYNTSIGSLGERIAKFHGAEIVYLPDSTTYSFRLDFELFESFLGQRPEITLEERCEAFTWEVGRNGK